MALAFGFAVALAPAFTQARAAQAPPPQSWVTDASILLGNALHASAVMANERFFAAQAPSPYADQAAYLVNTIQRALDDMTGLENNALASNRQVIPGIRAVIAELVSANADAGYLHQTAARGQLGPDYAATASSANQHLKNAMRSLNHVARMYNGASGQR
jgi:hypothetical protein